MMILVARLNVVLCDILTWYCVQGRPVHLEARLRTPVDQKLLQKKKVFKVGLPGKKGCLACCDWLCFPSSEGV